MHLSKDKASSNPEDVEILTRIGLKEKRGATRTIKRCVYRLPERGQIKANTDGSTTGNPPTSGLGISFRNHQGEFLLVVAGVWEKWV